MRVQIFSDLHVDVFPIKPITIVPDVDLVIVAGDTCEGVLRAFEHLRRLVPMDIPIVMVMGNHEYYRRFVPDELALARSQAPNFNIRLIENDSVTLGVGGNHGVRFVGATLWTDYGVFGEVKQAAVMNACAKGMNDHRLIGWQKKPWRRFRPQEAAVLHHQSRAYLKDALSKPFNGPSVMITHTAVHWNSVLPRFRHRFDHRGVRQRSGGSARWRQARRWPFTATSTTPATIASGIHGFCAIRTGTEMKTPTSTAPWWWRSSEGGRSLLRLLPALVPCL